MRFGSQAFAARLVKECGKPTRACEVQTAWKLALARPPSPAEQKLTKKFLSGGGSLAEMCLALLNRNEFVYVP